MGLHIKMLDYTPSFTMSNLALDTSPLVDGLLFPFLLSSLQITMRVNNFLLKTLQNT